MVVDSNRAYGGFDKNLIWFSVSAILGHALGDSGI